MHPFILLPIYFATTVAPLVLGWLRGKPSRPFWDEVASGLAMTAFATPLLLGGARTPLLTTLLYSYAYTLYDWNRAAAVALVLVVLAIGFYFIQTLVVKMKLKSYEN